MRMCNRERKLEGAPKTSPVEVISLVISSIGVTLSRAHSLETSKLLFIPSSYSRVVLADKSNYLIQYLQKEGTVTVKASNNCFV